jgi:hypothetical protein
MNTEKVKTIVIIFLSLLAIGLFIFSAVLFNSTTELNGKLTTQSVQITELQQKNAELETRANPHYFADKTALENWLATKPDLPASYDRAGWYKNAMTVQRWAQEDGFILSVSYYTDEYGTSITCDAYTLTGVIYWFDPETRVIKRGFDAGEFVFAGLET